MGCSVKLELADASKWRITAEDEASREIVALLRRVMRLETAGKARRTIMLSTLRSDGDPARTPADAVPLIDYEGEIIKLAVPPARDEYGKIDLCRRLVALISHDCERRGGILVHGGLAVHEEIGVIFAGPAEVGKTTTCERLPENWEVLCDDTAQVIRDSTSGTFWAQARPTWSRFVFDGPGGSWDCRRNVPLRAVFFLAQREATAVTPLHPARATALLVESVEQAAARERPDLSGVSLRESRLRSFESVSALVRAMPCFLLELNLEGDFWLLVEGVLQDLNES